MAVKKILKSSRKYLLVLLPESLTKKGLQKKTGETCKFTIECYFDKAKSDKK